MAAQKDISYTLNEWTDAFDYFEDVIFLLDNQLTLLKGNKSFYLHYDTTESHCRNKNIKNIIFPGDISEESALSSALSSREDNIIYVEHCLKANNKKIPAKITIKVLSNGNQKNYHTLVILKNLSEIKETLRSNQSSESTSSSFLQNFPCLVQQIKPDGKLHFVNKAWLDVMEYTREEALKLNISDIIPKKEFRKIKKLLSDVSRGENFKDLQTIFLSKSGKEVSVFGNGSGIFENDRFKFSLEIFKDLTANKQIENQFKTITGNIPGLVYRVNLQENNRMQFFNEMLFPLTGYKENELKKGMVCSIEPFIHKSDVKRVINTVQSSCNNQSAFNIEYRFYHKDGKLRHFQEIGRPEFNSDGKPIYIDGIILDITERVAAENNLYTLLRHKESMLASIPDIIMEVDNNLVYTWANKNGYNFFGDDVIGKDASYFFSDQQDIFEVIKPVLEGVKNSIYLENYQRRKDGEERLLAWWCNNLKNPEGEIIGAISTARDITEQRKSQKRQIELLKAIENANEVIFTTNREGTFTFINKQFSILYGYTPEEVINKVTPRILKSDFLSKKENEDFWKVLLSKKSISRSYTNKTKDGKLVEIEATADPIINNNGEITGFIGIQRDVTIQKNTEKKLKDSEQKYREMFELNPEGILTLNKKGYITTANPAVYYLTGYKPEELIGLHFIKLPTIIAKDIPRYLRLFKKFITTKKPDDYEYRWRHKNGIIKIGFIRVKLINKENKFNSILIIINDTTDRAQMLKDLKKNQYFLEKSQQMGNLGTWELDLVKNILSWTDETYRIFGVKPGTPLTYEKFLSFIHPDDQDYVDQEWKTALITKEYDINHRIIVNGKTKWVREKAELEYDKKENCIRAIGFTQDIDKQKKAEEELNAAYLKLHNLNKHLFEVREKERAKIALDLHDDLGQKITAINYDVSYIKNLVDDKSSEISKRLNSLSLNLRNALTGMQEIASELRPSIIDNLGLFPAIQNLFSNFKRNTNIKCVLILPENEIIEDKEITIMIFRIIQELLTNIARHSNASSVKLKIKEENNSMVIYLNDDGNGISEEEIDPITSFGIRGIKERVNLINGKINIRGINSKGTRVIILVPVN